MMTALAGSWPTKWTPEQDSALAAAWLAGNGFGIKTTALACGEIRDMLESADSMAWSAAARRRKENSNDWRNAVRFARRIATMPVQGHLAI